MSEWAGTGRVTALFVIRLSPQARTKQRDRSLEYKSISGEEKWQSGGRGRLSQRFSSGDVHTEQFQASHQVQISSQRQPSVLSASQSSLCVCDPITRLSPSVAFFTWDGNRHKFVNLKLEPHLPPVLTPSSRTPRQHSGLAPAPRGRPGAGQGLTRGRRATRLRIRL